MGMCNSVFSRTPSSIGTSVGEAELYAIGSGTADGLAILNLLQELPGLFLGVRLKLSTDSSTAKSITSRHGPGKNTKHIQTRYLYMQELVQSGILIVIKEKTEEKCADPLTKYVDVQTLQHLIGRMGMNVEKQLEHQGWNSSVTCDHTYKEHYHKLASLFLSNFQIQCRYHQ